ncbi:hypothetical protein [Paractinoplanes atraurantiacus]|uniref:Uncharacterized protein n=1 Tax=Paractinoplanes atraurantiacus TaxID=1036182 RepID=A0A285GZH1_9ACTN|nr:hypothetical protein [Actinoplanes atraurantiacus]SNY28897.1 hypothetical protein SAMN05421748_103153 [Actinoplanes atraurantiacus]
MGERYRLSPGARQDLAAACDAGQRRMSAAADRMLATIGRLNTLTGGRGPARAEARR